MTHTKTIDKATLEILAACSVEAAGIRINSGQLDRKSYARLNDILTLMGGKWNRTKKVHVFNEDPTELLDQVVETGEIIDKVKQFQFYETPEGLAERMIDLSEPREVCTALEPSAGHGAIAYPLSKRLPRGELVCIEYDTSKASVLHAQGLYVYPCNFTFWRWPAEKLFNLIVMNPPFSNRQDIKHIHHALTMLAPGGRLVAICSAGPGRKEEFKDLREHFVITPTGEQSDGPGRNPGSLINGRFTTDHWEDLPADTFKASGANVRTHLMRIRRSA